MSSCCHLDWNATRPKQKQKLYISESRTIYISGLLRYNSYTIPFIYLKQSIQWFLVYSQSYANIIMISFFSVFRVFLATPRGMWDLSSPTRD